jgi:hypothetical protein
MGSPPGRVARSGPQRRSAKARAQPSRALIAAARWRSGPPEGDAARLVERGRERCGEARGAGVGLLVVVLRGDAHEVLEAELQIERVALGAVDGSVTAITSSQRRVLVERGRASAAGHLAQRAQGLLDLRGLLRRAPERREAAGEGARRDRAAVPARMRRARRSQRSRRSKKR